jgi:hypothetical protein
MRIARGFCLFAVTCLAACGGKAKPAETAKVKPADSTTHVGSTAGIWRVLVTPGAKWVLYNTFVEQKDARPTLTVETGDVRKVGAADVARLKWTWAGLGASDEHTVGVPGQVAVTQAGVWLLDGELDDKGVAAELAKPPSQPNPPVKIDEQTREDGVYVHMWAKGDEPIVCVGEGPVPGADECEDVCFGEMCVGAKGGIVSVSGTWAPNFETYEQDGYKQ